MSAQPAGRIAPGAPGAASPWFDRPPRASGGPLLLCFPFAGGSAAAFRGWEAWLPEEIELCPVHLPGRGRRFLEAPLTTLTEMVAEVGQALSPLLDRRLVLFGHSMGAILAFELARWLRRTAARPPVALHVSGCVAPPLLDSEPRWRPASDAEFVEHVISLNGASAQVLQDPEAQRVLLPALRADFEAMRGHRVADEPPLGCAIHAYGGADDHTVPLAQLEPWREQTTGAFTLDLLPGGHFFIDDSRAMFMRRLAAHLRTTPACT